MYRQKLDQKILNVNVYKDASIDGFFAIQEFFGLSFKIKTDKRDGFYWRTTRKLLNGSLIVFSPDEFQQ